MKIRINSPTTFVITEQSSKRFKELTYQSPIGDIMVGQESYPEIAYFDYKTMVFVRGAYEEYDNSLLKVKDPKHMPHILQALKEFCTFNDEPFEIESCIL